MDNKEKFIRNFFENNGTLDPKKDYEIIYNLKDLFESLFWDKLESYGGFSKCPTCGSIPTIIRYKNKQYLPLRNNIISIACNRIMTSDDIIKNIQCCEHLYDFQNRKRYIKIDKTPFKNNKFIDTIKYVSLTEIDKELTIYTSGNSFIKRNLQYNPEKINDYLNWEEYIPYIETFKIQEEREEEKIIKELNISKQKKEIQILERLLLEAKEKLKALEGEVKIE